MLTSAAAPRKLVVGGLQTLVRSGGLFDARSWSAQTGLPVLKRNELDPPVAPLLQIKGELVSAEAIENSSFGTPPLRAISTPQWVRSSSRVEWASGLMLMRQPSFKAISCRRTPGATLGLNFEDSSLVNS